MLKLSLVVEGPAHAGKGHLLALLAHTLRSYGLDVVVQGESSHNAPKLAKSDEELVRRLAGTTIVLREMQTSI